MINRQCKSGDVVKEVWSSSNHKNAMTAIKQKHELEYNSPRGFRPPAKMFNENIFIFR